MSRDLAEDAVRIMYDLEKARVIATLLQMVNDDISPLQVRDTGAQIRAILEGAHNDVDVLRAALEGSS